MPIAEAEIRDRVRTFLMDNFLYMRPDVVLDDDHRLMERGVVDSMGIVEMLTFIEDEFGVTATDDEISEANLGSLRSIARFVHAKQSALSA